MRSQGSPSIPASCQQTGTGSFLPLPPWAPLSQTGEGETTLCRQSWSGWGDCREGKGLGLVWCSLWESGLWGWVLGGRWACFVTLLMDVHPHSDLALLRELLEPGERAPSVPEHTKEPQDDKEDDNEDDKGGDNDGVPALGLGHGLRQGEEHLWAMG